MKRNGNFHCDENDIRILTIGLFFNSVTVKLNILIGIQVQRQNAIKFHQGYKTTETITNKFDHNVSYCPLKTCTRTVVYLEIFLKKVVQFIQCFN